MISFNNDFLGYHSLEHIESFSGSDTKELYQKNLEIQPEDWYYRINQISYVRNSNGHRCKEIEDIDLDNYILFTGCSHTEGIGLKLEDTFPYVVSKNFNCDYYNLGIGGAGIDMLVYNLITWFSVISKKPKFVVVQWPEQSRFISSNIEDMPTEELVTCGPWVKDMNVKNILAAGNMTGFFQVRRLMAFKLLHNAVSCPIIEDSDGSSKFHDNMFPLYIGDTARDMVHGGVDTNIKHAEAISKIANKKLSDK